jgi:hypothetical protein
MVGHGDVAHQPARSGDQRRRDPRPLSAPIAQNPPPPTRYLPDGRRRARENQELGSSLGLADRPESLGLLRGHWMMRSSRKRGPGSFRDPGRPGSRPAWRPGGPGRGSCPCATGRRPVGRIPRSGRVEIRLGPAWVRYRGTATPETDPPWAVHHPVLVQGRHRARSSRPRVTLPRCRSSSWRPPAAMPTAPMSRARLLLPDRPSSVAVPMQPGACSGSPACAPHGPAVLHRVAE